MSIVYMPVDEAESPVKSSELLSIISCEETTVILPCDATGDTKSKIQWSSNDKHLSGGDSHFAVLEDGALQISDIRDSDGGMYRGTNEQAMKLIVNNTDETEKQLNQRGSN